MLQNLSVFHKELKKLMINFMRGSGDMGGQDPPFKFKFLLIYIKKKSQKYACLPPLEKFK